MLSITVNKNTNVKKNSELDFIKTLFNRDGGIQGFLSDHQILSLLLTIIAILVVIHIFSSVRFLKRKIIAAGGALALYSQLVGVPLGSGSGQGTLWQGLSNLLGSIF